MTLTSNIYYFCYCFCLCYCVWFICYFVIVLPLLTDIALFAVNKHVN
jgi:hypothetical protein